MSMPIRKVIIDCDPGIADAVALCLALFIPTLKFWPSRRSKVVCRHTKQTVMFSPFWNSWIPIDILDWARHHRLKMRQPSIRGFYTGILASAT